MSEEHFCLQATDAQALQGSSSEHAIRIFIALSDVL